MKRHERTLHAAQYEPLVTSEAAHLANDEGDIRLISLPRAPDPPPVEVQMIQNGHGTASSVEGTHPSDGSPLSIQSPTNPGTLFQPPLHVSHDRPLTDVQSTPLDFMDTLANRNEQHLSIGLSDHFSSPKTPHRNMQGLSQAEEALSDNFFAASMEMLIPHFDEPEPSPQLDFEPLSTLRSSFFHSLSAYIDGPTPPQDLGSQLRSFEQLPRILRETSVNPPRLTVTDEAYKILCSDVMNRLGYDVGLQQFATRKQIQRFLTSYVDCFHCHLPFLHLPSLSVIRTPSPLILSVCSIGALYRLDRRRARSLYDLADRLVIASRKSQDSQSGTGEDPLWAVQSRSLLTFYAFFSGDASIASTAFERVGHFAISYRRIRNNLANETSSSHTSWESWINRESRRRLLCAIYIINNLVVVTFEVTPGLVNSSDLEFEAPEEERLWNSTTETAWEELWREGVSPHCKTVRSIMADVVSGHQRNDINSTEPYRVPAFTMLVIMHAVCVHMWLSVQFSQMLSSSTHNFSGPRDLRIALLATTGSTLARCESVISREGKEEQEISWDDPDGPLLFNCQALLRIAYTRQFTVMNAFNRPTLFDNDLSNVMASVSAYASAQQARSHFLTHAAGKACEGFLGLIRIGPLLVRKTAALNWSMEHAIAGWDSGTIPCNLAYLDY